MYTLNSTQFLFYHTIAVFFLQHQNIALIFLRFSTNLRINFIFFCLIAPNSYIFLLIYSIYIYIKIRFICSGRGLYMNIAICDRYDTDITRISEFLDANIKNHMLNHALLEVDTFTSTDELLASPKEYSLIFLGILMPGTDGIEAARQLKDGPNPPIIIFTTKSTEHCLASYNLGVEGYILKPIREEDFEKVFTRLLLPIFPSTHTLNVYSNRLLYHIPVSEIFYIESIGRKCMIHTSRKTYETNMALNHIESTLNDNSFIRCYRSYLVNMNYIQDILDTEIQLTNDDCIPLTLRKRSQIVKLFNKFLISHSASE